MSFGNDSHCLLSLSRARRLAFRLQREIDPALFERYGPDPTSDWHCEGRDLVLVAGVGSSKTDCAGRQFLDPVPTSSFDSAVLGDKRENTRPRTIDHFDSCADERAPSRRADNLSPYGRPTAVPHRPGRTWTRRPIVVAGECRQNRECNEQRSLHDLSFRPRRPESDRVETIARTWTECLSGKIRFPFSLAVRTSSFSLRFPFTGPRTRSRGIISAAQETESTGHYPEIRRTTNGVSVRGGLFRSGNP